MNTKNQVKTKTKTYTTSELASICGVTVGSISVFIKKNNLKPTKTGQNNAKYYDDDVLKQLQLHYAKSKPKRDKTNNTQDLRTQLAVSNAENELLRDQLDTVRIIVTAYSPNVSRRSVRCLSQRGRFGGREPGSPSINQNHTTTIMKISD